jgi:DNA (cytosine-5)-methyltransferase 1
MNVLDLFSGIGGFSLGLERAGMRTVAFCERDEFCRAVLAKHWPGVPCFDDIHTLGADGLAGLGPIDLVCGGFPCQPFSVAGDQRAHQDDRHLWPEMRRVIALQRPAWVIGENVTGIVALALDDVLFDLEALGYATRTFIIPACAVDAQHRRDRVWIIAHRNSGGLAQQPECDRGASQREDGACRNDLERLCDPVANSPSPRLQGGGAAREVWRREFPTGGSRDAHNRWLPEPDVGRVATGVPRRVDRLRALGNAVVPQVVYELGRAIMAHG